MDITPPRWEAQKTSLAFATLMQPMEAAVLIYPTHREQQQKKLAQGHLARRWPLYVSEARRRVSRLVLVGLVGGGERFG